MVSTIDACEQAILTLLTARAGTGGTLEGVSITPAGPTKDEDFPQSGELIYLGETNGEDDWASLGGGRRQETYRVQLVIGVEQWGDDPQATKTRMRALWAEARDTLIDDLRGTTPGAVLRTAGVLQFDRITHRQRTGPVSAEKWGAICEAQIEFRARTV